MFHIELRQFPHSAWRFNLSEPELRVIVLPWVREEWTEVGERKWNPHEAKLTILEGPALATGELSMGRGWRSALRGSEDVTERVLGTAGQAERERAAAEESARIEQAARAQLAAAGQEGTSAEDQAGTPELAGGATLGDPLALGVQLAALLGSEPTRLLAAWQQAAAAAPGASPSDTLAYAEQVLASGGTSG